VNIAIVVSGGIGKRFGEPVPKQYQEIKGRKIISFVIDALKRARQVDKIIVAAHEDYRKLIEETYHVEWCASGAERNRTLRNAVDYVYAHYRCEKAIVLDAVMPLIDPDVIDNYLSLLDQHQVVATAQKITVSLGSYDFHTVDRERYYLLSSPEAFNFSLLHKYLDGESKLVEVTQQLPPLGGGTDIFLYFDQVDNFKLVYKRDLRIMQLLLEDKGLIPKNSEELIMLHAIQKEILDEFVRVCEKHKLSYFITGGTALGARRHKGFIPWDDDIDVGMPRDDYEQFKSICADELADKYIFTSWETKENFPSLYGKLYRRNTLFIEPCMRDKSEYAGIFIDIFPYDNVINSKRHLAKRHSLLQRLHRLLSAKKRKVNLRRHPHKIFRQLFYKLISYKMIRRIQEKIITWRRNKESDYFTQWTGYHGYECETFPKDMFFPLGKIEFEGAMYNCPGDMDSYLTQMYGADYMELPPESERQGHNPVLIIFDTEQTEEWKGFYDQN
jgi:lipopolysaccharide cholinephosphotransferase